LITRRSVEFASWTYKGTIGRLSPIALLRQNLSAAIGTVFVQDSADNARAQWRNVADQLRGKFSKLGALLDEAENDLLAFMTFPRAHWTRIYSTNPLERLNDSDSHQLSAIHPIAPPQKSGKFQLAGPLGVWQALYQATATLGSFRTSPGP
jgi:hypothetical protein